nr:hypothetical protein [Mycolicibacterium frederiksbergense]
MSVAKTPGDHHSGVPASNKAVAWVWRNQCGVHPSGPMPRRRSVATFSRTVVSRNAANNGGLATFTSSGDVSIRPIPDSAARQAMSVR